MCRPPLTVLPTATPRPRNVSRRVFNNLFGKGKGDIPPSSPTSYPGTTPSASLHPKCDVLAETPNYQLRLYTPFPVAQTPYEARDEGFLRLGDYISGPGNQASLRLIQSQPVFLEVTPTGKRMSVWIPEAIQDRSTGKMQPIPGGSVPLPTDPLVTLGVIGGLPVAAALVKGYVTPDAAQRARAKLLQALAADGIRAAEGAEENFTILQYGPLFQLTERENEILVPISLS